METNNAKKPTFFAEYSTAPALNKFSNGNKEVI